MIKEQFKLGNDTLDVSKVFTEEGKPALKCEVTFGENGHSLSQTYEFKSKAKRDIEFDKIDNEIAAEFIKNAINIFNDLTGEEV